MELGELKGVFETFVCSYPTPQCRAPIRRLMDGVDWPDGVGTTLRDLRAFYASWTYYTIGARRGMQPWAWIAQVLGHSEGDTDTPQSYHKIAFDQEPLTDDVVED